MTRRKWATTTCDISLAVTLLIFVGCSTVKLQRDTTRVVGTTGDSITFIYTRLWGTEYMEAEARAYCSQRNASSVFHRRETINLDRDYMTYRCVGRQRIVQPSPLPAKPERRSTTGTGFLVSSDGLVVTAFHVIEETRQTRVDCPDLGTSPAHVVRTAPGIDLAILQIAQRTPHYLSLSRSAVEVGTPVFTVGFPAPDLLGKEPKFTEGTVSALTGLQGNATLLQISVPVQSGNSGGPLVKDTGEVVGLVIATVSPSVFFQQTGGLPQNINWAVKAGYVLPLLDGLATIPHSAELMNRSDAIRRTTKATCLVVAESVH